MGSFGCTQRPMSLRSPPHRASLGVRIVLAAGWSIGAGCPSSGGQRTALLHRKSSAFKESRWLAGRARRTPVLGLQVFQAVAFPVPPGAALANRR
jgi:hypothetical protein